MTSPWRLHHAEEHTEAPVHPARAKQCVAQLPACFLADLLASHNGLGSLVGDDQREGRRGGGGWNVSIGDVVGQEKTGL